MRSDLESRVDSRTVEAARAGDREALDRLVAGSLPLVYNIVGRALNGHADTDDVVQETMIRVVGGLGGLRDPARFRSWLVAIAVRQVRDRARRRAGQPPAEPPPGPDFAELTVLRLQLEGERREVVESVRWLDDADRRLFSLWSLEVAGELTRREVAAALGLTRQHAAVRVQRMKSRLEAARGIVRALDGGCPELAEITLTGRWDGRPDSVWRKRLARHVRSCPQCGTRRGTVPAERLLTGLSLVPLPAGFTLGALAKVPASAAASAGLMAKAAVAVTAGATLAGGGAYVLEHRSDPPPPRAAAPAIPSASDRAAPRTTPSPSAPSPRPALSVYGSVVDTVDEAPDPRRQPGPLPRRRETGVTLSTGINADLKHRGESVAFRGRGYLMVRWQVVNGGQVSLPTWTGLTGKLFHVASGGGRRLDDPRPGTSQTWMGLQTGTATLPRGAQQMWQNEYYYLNGTVTLHQTESSEADYNIFTKAVTHTEIVTDLRTPPDGEGIFRYGLVRDTGDDSTPVPQYLTRARDPEQVPQRSRVRQRI